MLELKKFLLLCLLCISSLNIFAHNHLSHDDLRTWTIAKKDIKASFLLQRNDTVYLEQKHALLHVAFKNLSKTDQAFVLEKQHAIETLNISNQNVQILDNQLFKFNKIAFYNLCFLFFGGLFYFIYKQKSKHRLAFSIAIPTALLALFSFKILLGTDPKIMDQAFQPFKPNIATHWDNTYFYVESNGIPTTHSMMTGITGWQQQAPIPQCYTGTNAWSIPLNPVVATTPVPVNAMHFSRGAIAIAANGIPIFNPYTNTGVDAFVDGQLDNWGGHCGRADDYHYHTAPLHLHDFTNKKTLPIAYALDGFAVYGSLEPDGSAMKLLDTNHGHNGTDGVYHYHGTKDKPYMIGNMVGKVTEDATMQIIPQAAAKPIRPAGMPLKGAVITDLQANTAKNGYILSYKLNNQIYKWDYNWDNLGNYTFNYINPDATKTTTVYKGQKPCFLTVATAEISALANQINVFPNPTQHEININLNDVVPTNEVKNMSIFTMDGKLFYSKNEFQAQINTSNFPQGVYLLQIKTADYIFNKKIVVE